MKTLTTKSDCDHTEFILPLQLGHFSTFNIKYWLNKREEEEGCDILIESELTNIIKNVIVNFQQFVLDFVVFGWCRILRIKLRILVYIPDTKSTEFRNKQRNIKKCLPNV